MRNDKNWLARTQLFLTLSLAAAFIGCGGGERTVVTGSVKLDGQPLAGAEVRFVAEGNNPGLGVATARTDESGAFTIQPDARDNNLLQPGSFVVLISKVIPKESGGGMGTPTVNMVPPVYSQQSATPLHAEIKQGQNKLSPFELASAKK
jgi:hypothetical protein